ncbi:unnamed protein product [Fusarium graminearum]|uniref:Heterokaryon incompatibility domain-containing protein n=1 Tax=Gibberella zeae TaxID=5518 RepID=A0A4E9D5R2_GIBZA|nr:unnamed protein product [Fusarium graminearum]CAG1964973.1 unnamed protein product [Fusarium graminearum]CAG2007715.1 unnamed protein product [Fusarium graminearum]
MSLTSSQPPLAKTPSNELLCQKCRDVPWDIFFSIPSPLTIDFDYHGTFAQLEDSYKEGCPMCQNLCVMLVYDDFVLNRDDPLYWRLAPETLQNDMDFLLKNIDEWLTACTRSGKHRKCNQSARTTELNIQQRKKQMALQDFPKTIQDAIKITRRMGIRYLWVDAVCIIQPDDDGETKDWQKESANMANYYSNAYCCIAASSAEDSSEGILVERPVGRFPFIEWRNRGGRVLQSPHSSRRLFRNPLLERGWCLQEWILSPRILHWTRNGLIWQCKEGFLWESQSGFHGTYPEHFSDPLGKYVRSSIECPFDMGITSEPRTEIWQILETTKDRALGYHWSELVYCYSQMNLTKPGDRLAAIQGIATYLPDRYKVDYFAGIFHHKLLDGLLWVTVPGEGYSTKTEGFPSWSWASCRGTIRMRSIPNAESTPWMRWTPLYGLESRYGLPWILLSPTMRV